MPDSMKYSGDVYAIHVPKKIAEITLCGAVRLDITEIAGFIKPTEEQIRNLRETFCIDVKILE